MHIFEKKKKLDLHSFAIRLPLVLVDGAAMSDKIRKKLDLNFKLSIQL